MLLLADTHVHLYPTYDLAAAFDAAHTNFARRLAEVSSADGVGAEAEGVGKVLCLTERADCNFFRGLRGGAIEVPGGRYTIHDHGDAVLMVSRDHGESLLLLLAGRQIVTRERLEVLALGLEAEIPDGSPIDEVLNQVRALGGVPVLPWAVGKWFFGRGRVVRRIVSAAQKNDILIGDSSLRPAGWREPRSMRVARSRGIRVIAGSDPLPFRGEEVRLGSYVIVGQTDFNWRDPAGSIRAMLQSCPSLAITGERGDLRTVWSRLTGLRQSRREERKGMHGSTAPETVRPAA